MSNTNDWQNRLKTHRWSQDDRQLAYNYKKSIDAAVNAWLDDFKATTMSMGKFNMATEPWRLSALNEFRSHGVKIIEKPAENLLVELVLVKKKLSEHRLG